MPLEAPKLDTRNFESLLSEARLRIPRYTPEWTDFNDSDPGMTIVQLFAWLTEMTLFELNRVPELTFVNFLKLLGRDLKPAQPAKTHLTFSVQEGARQVDPVPERTQVMATPPDGGNPLIFETTQGLDLIRPKLDRIRVFDGANYIAAGRPFPAFGWVPQPGNALYLGFADPPGSSPAYSPFPQQMRFRVALMQRGKTPSPVSSRDIRRPARPPASLVWEYNASATSSRWVPLDVIEDKSIAFTRDGDIAVEGPPASIPLSTAAGIADERYWLRCRLAAGSYPAGAPPEIDLFLPNTVEAENLSTVREEFVGISEGYPEQVFTLANHPVKPETLRLTVSDPDGTPVLWEQRPDFFDSGPSDTHYIFSEATGEIQFGDGKKGGIPVAGSEIVAETYLFGGGSAGNLPNDSINTLLSRISGVSEVTNRLSSVGGADEEKVKDAAREAPRLLRSRNRAVTAEDFALIARDAGGVAKATAIELTHPDFPGVEVPGAIQVVIVPMSGDLAADRKPTPSSDQMRSVCEYLDQFRLITTELTVTAPDYQAITVEALIETRKYASLGQVERDVSDAIDEYLDPLGRRVRRDDARQQDNRIARPGEVVVPAPGGDELGWPFGKELYRSSLFGVILRNPDIVAVTTLRLLVDNVPPVDQDAPVKVKRNGLVYSAGNHRLTIRPARDL